MAISAAELLKAIEELKINDPSGYKKLQKAFGGDSSNVLNTAGLDSKQAQQMIKDAMALADQEERLARLYNDSAAARKAAHGKYMAYSKLEEEAYQDNEGNIKRISEQLGMSADAARKLGGEQKKAATIRALAAERGIEITEQELDRMKALSDQYRTLGPLHEKGLAAGKKHFGALGRMMGVSTNGYANSIFGKMAEIGAIASTPKGMQGLVEAFRATINVANAAAAIFSKMISNTTLFFTEIDNAASSLAAYTGNGDRATESIGRLSAANRINGISTAQVGKAIQGLTDNFGGFMTMGAKTKEVMVNSAAQLAKIGVSAQDSGQLMNFFAKGMGHSAEKSAQLTKNVAMMGKQMGINASKFAKGLNASLQTLAVYGDKSVEVFSGLAAAAAAAGVEVGSLLALANKFDTFEGAAKSVGKLNAIMGSQLNATDMLMKTEDQRIETLIQTVQATGMNFKDMNRFQQKAIANAAGITDMNEAMKIFSMNMGDYKNFSKAQSLAQDQQEELNKRMQDATPILLKIKMMFAELVIAIEPLVDKISEGVTAVHKFITENKVLVLNTVKFIGIFAGLFLAFKTFTFLAGILSAGALPALAAGMFGLAPASAAAAGGITTVATGVAGAMGILATGVATAGAGMMAALPATGLFVLVMGALGLASLAVGMGIALAAGSIAALVGVLIYAVTSGAIGSILEGMVALQTTAMVLGVFGSLAALGIGAMALAMGGLALAMYALPLERLSSLAIFAKGMAEMENNNVESSFKAATTFVADLNTNSENIKPMLQNIALMTTGVSAESGAMGLLGAAIIGVGKAVGDIAKKDQKEMLIKLDGEATTKLMRGEAVKVAVGTGY